MDARMIAIADEFDAMTCNRTYNELKPTLEVVVYLEENTDTNVSTIISILRRKVKKEKWMLW